MLDFNRNMAKSKGKKLIFIIIGCVLFAALLVWFGFAAYVQVNYRNTAEHKEGAVTKYIAHRGLSSEYFENSYDAFYEASMRTFFSGIECDIRLTKDQVWVCSHDDNPFYDTSVKISESSFDDIKGLPLNLDRRGEFVDGGKQVFIATLEEYLETLKYSYKTGYIEIKCDLTKNQAAILLENIKSGANMKRIVLCSFDKNVIDTLLAENRSLTVMLFTSNDLNSYLYSQMGFSVGMSVSLLEKRPQRIEQLHKKKSAVNVYVINDKAEADKYVLMGVDYITTDYDLNKARRAI